MNLVILKMDICPQIPLILGRPFLNTMKSTGMKEFPILTRISFAVPTTTRLIDPPAADAGK
jgi:hypothetical protein